ncbi:MAG TPA: O-antigen ligase family protein [Phycisphaerales bacterium]|nr:O-antigen ligase family protein [Phycisphaerales bacterium]
MQSVSAQYSILRRVQEDGPWLLILLAMVLLPFRNAANAPMAVMAVIGGIMLIRNAKLILVDHRARLLFVLFGCIWLPMLISLPTAVEPKHSLSTSLMFLRFPLAGVFVLSVLERPEARKRLTIATAALLGVWCVDGLIQWQAGRNLLGQPYDGHNLTGLFHPKRVIGLVVAALAPVCFEEIRRLVAGRSMWMCAASLVLAMPLVLVIALGGSRTSWMMGVMACASWGAYQYWRSEWRYRHRLALLIILAGVVSVPLIARVPGMESRVNQTLQLLKGDLDAIDRATSGRVPIWTIALEMARDYPLTGVGPRGFRYKYVDYADSDTPYIAPDGESGAAHPHQIVLEVATETGIIGLMGFAAFCVIIVRLLLDRNNVSAAPWILAVLVAMFPLNAHMAIYGNFWAHVAWWTILVMIGMMPRIIEKESA